MVSFRNPKKQARHALQSLTAIGTPRYGNKKDGRIHSLGTKRTYESQLSVFTKYLQDHRLGDLQNFTSETARQYLEDRSEEVSQSTLDLDRQALQALLKVQLPFIHSDLKSIQASRAYTATQVELVADAQSAKYKLSTLIVDSSGIRAHELLTLRRADERRRDTHREYRNDRFAIWGNTFVLYTAVGKGGLCREVAIDEALAKQLEMRRLDVPRSVWDRKIQYEQYYDLGGGHDWTNSFTKASKRALGWSKGGHGVRHGYAQARMNALQGSGYTYDDALELVSQEMGHFRASITEVYLR